MRHWNLRESNRNSKLTQNSSISINNYFCSFPLFKGKSLSLICGALKWLVDSEERKKVRIEAVLAGELPASVLEEPGISMNSNGKEKGDTPATESTATTQGY